MDRILNYLACVTQCALPGIAVLFGMFAAMGILLTILALIGVATLITIPGIWAIVAAAFGVSAAAILVGCLLDCGFRTEEETDGGGAGTPPPIAGAIDRRPRPVLDFRLAAVAAALTLWYRWDSFF
jgi:hypothetical protein